MATLNDILVSHIFSDVQLGYLETLSISRKFNLVLLYKDRRQKSFPGLDQIQLEDIKEQLSDHNIQYVEGRPLNWSLIMKEIRADPQQFTEAGGWKGLDLGRIQDLMVRKEPRKERNSLSPSSPGKMVRRKMK